jgi:hypothetical protein
LLFQNLYYLLNHNIVVAIRNVLDSSQSGNNHTDERRNGMLERFIFHVKNFKQKLKILGLGNLENVSSDKLLNECFSELRRDLESVDSEAQ